MLRLLADTCVWIDLVNDYRHEPVLSAVEHLVEAGTVSLVVTRLVVEEFARRKGEVVRGSVQGIAATLKRAREVVAQSGTEGGRPAAMAELHDVDLRLRARGGQALAAAEVVVDDEAELQEPGGPEPLRVGQHEAQRPDDVRGDAPQHLALHQRLAHEAELAVFEEAQPAVDQLGGGRGGGGPEARSSCSHRSTR